VYHLLNPLGFVAFKMGGRQDRRLVTALSRVAENNVCAPNEKTKLHAQVT